MHERIIDDLQVTAEYVLEIYDGFRGIRGCVVGESVVREGQRPANSACVQCVL